MNFIILILIQLILIDLAFCDDDKPLIQEFIVPKNLNENQTIKLSCELIQGKQPINIDWYLTGRKLEDDNNYYRLLIFYYNRIKIRKTDDSSILIIKYLSVDDNGDYYCLASNQYGEHKRHASVYVNTKPQWTIEPKNITSSLNKDIVLECEVKSYPQSEIKWIRLSSNGETIINEFNTNLIKFNLNKETSGFYKCISTNLIGSIDKIIHVGYFSKY